ncbi:MAG: xanthine phosphoribosyltransferase [Eubacteriales bacterium]|nr:xanthine phosphoribosyltransferase [Eubacteriales bacterium]
MNFLEAKICSESTVLPGNILLVDTFLNQGLDIETLSWLGADFARHFKDRKIDLVLTIEASGIAIAVLTAAAIGVNAAFAKKHESLNLSGELLCSKVCSYTKQKTYTAAIAKHLIKAGMKVLIVDDFLANGCAMQGLISLVEMAGAEVAGVAVAIEKAFQGGGDMLRKNGYDVYAAARIKEISESGFSLLQD